MGIKDLSIYSFILFYLIRHASLRLSNSSLTKAKKTRFAERFPLHLFPLISSPVSGFFALKNIDRGRARNYMVRPRSLIRSHSMKTLFILAILLVSASGVLSQAAPAGVDLLNYGVRIEPDKRLMAVLATLEMARATNSAGEEVPAIKTPLSKQGEQFRELLRSDSAMLPADLRQKISQFVNTYKKRRPSASDSEIVAPFISMAYSLSPAPDLADPVVTGDLPGELLDVLDFAPLVREFYRRSTFSTNLTEYQKTYQRSADTTLRPTAREMVSELLDYLHTRPQTSYTERIKTATQKGKSKKTTLERVEVREAERRFFIVPELLAPVGTITFLNIKDDYHVIVPPETDLRYSDARRAFLQFVIDPLVLGNARDLSASSAGIKTLLDERRKTDPNVSPDIYRAVARSLVAAADVRQLEHLRTQIATAQARQKIDKASTAAEKSAVSAELARLKATQADESALRLSEDYEKGAVLAFYFAEQLRGLEDSGFDIASSLRDMILSLDPSKEAGRLEQYSAARDRAVAARNTRRSNSEAATIVAENPVTVRLIEIQKLIESKNYPQAKTWLGELLAKDPDEPRVLYNLGRVASLEAEALTDADEQNRKLLEAKKAYEDVIKSAEKKKAAKQAVDPALISLSYVALAKFYEFYDDPQYAVKVYDAAIKVGDVAGGAYSEAIAGKQRLLKNP